MEQLLLHPDSRRQLDKLLRKAPHALLITGKEGMGKGSVARNIVAALIGVESDKLANSGTLLEIVPDDKGTIGIDQIRRLSSFMSLKTLGKRSEIRRAVVIENAAAMGAEAQNALLKILEEPPADSLIILTAAVPADLLPTVVSRCQVLGLTKPDREELSAYLAQKGEGDQVAWAVSLSGGLPGLAIALLNDNLTHPLKVAADNAKLLLSQPAYERLKNIDNLSKDRQNCINLCDILQHMAHLALPRSSGTSADRWQRILTSAYECGQALRANGNVRLSLTRLMLEL